MEDGSSILADIDACHFGKFGYDIYEMCELKGLCDLEEAVERLTSGITGNSNNDNSNSNSQGNNNKNSSNNSIYTSKLMFQLIGEASKVLGVA